MLNNLFFNLFILSIISYKCFLKSDTLLGGDCCDDTNTYTLSEALDNDGLIAEASCILGAPLEILKNTMNLTIAASTDHSFSQAQQRRIRAHFDTTWMYNSQEFILSVIGQYTIPDPVIDEPIIPVIVDLDCAQNGPTLNTHDIQNIIAIYRAELEASDFSGTAEEEAILQGQILYLSNLIEN